MIDNYHPIETIVENGLAPSIDWLRRRLTSGEIGGCKVGTKWLMSDDDVNDMLESRRNGKRAMGDTRRVTTSTIDHGGFTAGTSKRRSA